MDGRYSVFPLIGVVGVAGVGKSTTADLICELVPGAVQIALADPLKRFAKQVFSIDPELLWGDSKLRETKVTINTFAIKNFRYQPYHVDESVFRILARHHDGNFASLIDSFSGQVTVREILQKLGDFGRQCFINTWIDEGIRVAKELLSGGHRYTPEKGLIEDVQQSPIPLVVISDGRMSNEILKINEVGGKCWKINGHTSINSNHISETQVGKLSPFLFDKEINNVDLHRFELKEKVKQILDGYRRT